MSSSSSLPDMRCGVPSVPTNHGAVFHLHGYRFKFLTLYDVIFRHVQFGTGFPFVNLFLFVKCLLLVVDLQMALMSQHLVLSLIENLLHPTVQQLNSCDLWPLWHFRHFHWTLTEILTLFCKSDLDRDLHRCGDLDRWPPPPLLPLPVYWLSWMRSGRCWWFGRRRRWWGRGWGVPWGSPPPRRCSCGRTPRTNNVRPLPRVPSPQAQPVT